jgi:hypothetical protein
VTTQSAQAMSRITHRSQSISMIPPSGTAIAGGCGTGRNRHTRYEVPPTLPRCRRQTASGGDERAAPMGRARRAGWRAAAAGGRRRAWARLSVPRPTVAP